MPSSISQAPDFFDYLGRSLEVLEAGMPSAYQAVCAAAGELSARLIANGRVRVLSFQGRVPVLEQDRAADVEVVFDNQVLLELIDGEISLEDALFLDRLQIRGLPAAVERLHTALMLYLNGAVRVSGCLALLRCFREARFVAE
jgi:hypothetical protein